MGESGRFSWSSVLRPSCRLSSSTLALDKLCPLQEGEHLDAFVETADCSTDPVQVLLNCTTGNRHLVVRERGKHVFTVQKPGCAIRIVLTGNYWPLWERVHRPNGESC